MRPASSSGPKPHARCDQVSVDTSARLHFGFLDPSGRGERPFGSFGLAIDRPRTRLTLTRSKESAITGVDCVRAEPYLRTITASLGGASRYHLHLDEVIPSHAGLGSGTQLALAIGSAVAALEGLSLDLYDIAAKLARGTRSGIGIGTFGQGGIVLDGGPGAGALPPLLCRLPFPSEWRVLLIFDAAATGMHGAQEIEAFSVLPNFPEIETAELRRRVLQLALPAIAECDFKTFCDQVGYMQARMGAYFGPLQGGAFVSPDVAQAIGWLKQQGLTGVGQSSWGPTGFAFVASEQEGQRLLDEACARTRGSTLRFELASARNKPATIEAR